MAAIVPRLREGFFESSCSTIFQNSKFRFKWTIHDFPSYWKLVKTKIVSSTFSDGTDTGLKWQLEINPTSLSDQSSQNHQKIPFYIQYLSLNLKLVSNGISPFKANCKFSILDAKLNNVNKLKYDHTFGATANPILSIPHFIAAEKLFHKDKEILSHESLTILCEIIASLENIHITNELTIPACHEPNNLGLALLENPDFSDFTLCADGNELKVHKAILASRSNVFKAMFQHNTKESQTNRVQISDVDYDVLEAMVHFIYTDEFSSMQHLPDLLRAADKYELERLKLRCEEALGKNLSTQNAAECYIVADQVKAENLKALARSFVIANATYIAKTPGFALLIQEHSDLVIEALS